MPPKKHPVSSVKRNGKAKQKQKQRQQQTVIVNINKQKRSTPRGNGIEKPKEQQKEQPKTTHNSFSFSMPQAQQNQLGEYLKSHNKELYRKLDEVLKSKDPVINSVDDRLKPIISVNSPERIPTPLEIATPKSFEQTLQENYLQKQGEQTPLNIGEEIHLDEVTTLDEPSRSLSLDEPILNPPPQPTTIESITTATTPYKDIPIELGVEQPIEPVEITNKEPTETTKETIKSLQQVEDSPDLFTNLSRGRGRPAGSKDTVPRIRRTEAELLSSPPGRSSSMPRIRNRINNRYEEETPTPPNKSLTQKSTPTRRGSINIGSSIIGTKIPFI